MILQILTKWWSYYFVNDTLYKTALVRKNTPWQTKPHQKLMEHKMCQTICIVTKPHRSWQGVHFFTNTVYREIDALHMCHSKFNVLLPHISPWTQSWIQAFIVAYQNLTFKSVNVKQNCCFRNQRWDAAKSCQALKKGCIKSTNQNAIFFARIYQTPIWIGTKINIFLINIFTNQ